MPLYTYDCGACGKPFDVYVHSFTDPTRDVRVCTWGGRGKRRTVYRIRKLGPETHELEAHEQVLLGQNERAAGVRLRGPADIAAREKEMGVHRTTSSEHRHNSEMGRDIVATESRIAKEDGEAGVIAARTKEEVQDATGWDNAQYARWSAPNDAAWAALADGSLPQEALVPVAPRAGAALPDGGAESSTAGGGSADPTP